MRRRVIAFDLDGTLAETKSAISDVMADRLRDLLYVYDVSVISGGKFEQFKLQLIDRLDVTPEQMSRLHIMPTSGTSYFRFDERNLEWVMQYSEELSAQTRAEIVDVLTTGAKELGYWETKPYGDIIEDRGSQITFSALGQQAPAEKKYAWDPDGVKKESLRDFASKQLPDLEVHVGGSTSVDVTEAGIDKAYGMRKLMTALDLASDEILFFGDKLDEGGNDYPVKSVGIDTIAVKSWEETAAALEAIIEVSELSQVEKTTTPRPPGRAVASTRGNSSSDPIPVARADVYLSPDWRRVIVKPFLPDEQLISGGGLLDRILAMSEGDVGSALAVAYARYENRHLDLETAVENHFQFVADEAGGLPELSRDRRLLIGAYYTREYSIEAAALTNPSIVPAPDQSGLAPGAQRFVMSLRAIGEGHVSSIEFRSGVIDASGGISIEKPSRRVDSGTRRPPVFDKAVFCAKLEEMDAFNEMAKLVIDPLPDRFELHDLEDAIATVEGTRAPRRLSDPTCRTIHWLATSNYEVAFASESKVSERVLFSGSSIESHGLEDARFVRFTDDDGSVTYYATYTAYDGSQILPQLIETVDFQSFRMATLRGKYAKNKGAALFPRRIDGRFVALSRHDGENNYVLRSDDLRTWEESESFEFSRFSWDLARIGNCGSPLETEAGWLVVTHGVGPFREYSLGAILLDIDDPGRVIGQLDQPLLASLESERDGYVPNVVYSCGSMVHGDQLILPYGVSDVATRIAKVPIDDLLARLVG